MNPDQQNVANSIENVKGLNSANTVRMATSSSKMLHIARTEQEAHEPECSHVKHVCKTCFLDSPVHVSHVTIPMHCRLWNVEEIEVQSVGLWSVECRVWRLCRVCRGRSKAFPFWRCQSVKMKGCFARNTRFDCRVWSVESILHTPRSPLYTPRSTLHSLHFTLHTLYSTLNTLHCTLHILYLILYTLHSTLYTVHTTLYTLHWTLCTLQFTMRTSHVTLHLLHFAI